MSKGQATLGMFFGAAASPVKAGAKISAGKPCNVLASMPERNVNELSEKVSTFVSNSLFDKSWMNLLMDEFKKDYFTKIVDFVENERKSKTVYPPHNLIFNALNLCPFENVKVVILGQDPYHGPGQAHGLAFSVCEGVAVPPSLKNIYKEISSDPDIKPAFTVPKSGNLSAWCKSGCLLLNATLTVEKANANSHLSSGWTKFTQQIISLISNHHQSVVFMLWGKNAQANEKLINKSKHLVLKSTHPSPLSAHTGWFGNKHFSKANAYLASHGREPILWQLNGNSENSPAKIAAKKKEVNARDINPAAQDNNKNLTSVTNQNTQTVESNLPRTHVITQNAEGFTDFCNNTTELQFPSDAVENIYIRLQPDSNYDSYEEKDIVAPFAIIENPNIDEPLDSGWVNGIVFVGEDKSVAAVRLISSETRKNRFYYLNDFQTALTSLLRQSDNPEAWVRSNLGEDFLIRMNIYQLSREDPESQRRRNNEYTRDMRERIDLLSILKKLQRVPRSRDFSKGKLNRGIFNRLAGIGWNPYVVQYLRSEGMLYSLHSNHHVLRSDSNYTQFYNEFKNLH